MEGRQPFEGAPAREDGGEDWGCGRFSADLPFVREEEVEAERGGRVGIGMVYL